MHACGDAAVCGDIVVHNGAAVHDDAAEHDYTRTVAHYDAVSPPVSCTTTANHKAQQN